MRLLVTMIVEPIETQAEAYLPRGGQDKESFTKDVQSVNQIEVNEPYDPNTSHDTNQGYQESNNGDSDDGASRRDYETSPQSPMVPPLNYNYGNENHPPVINSGQNTSRMLDTVDFRSEHNNSSLIRNLHL